MNTMLWGAADSGSQNGAYATVLLLGRLHRRLSDFRCNWLDTPAVLVRKAGQ